MKNPKILETVKTYYREAENAEKTRIDNLRREAYTLHPDYAAADRETRRLEGELMRARHFGLDCDALRRSLDIARTDLAALTSRYGIDLRPLPKCQKCGDSGFVGENMCDCAKRLYDELLAREYGLQYMPVFDFDDNSASRLGASQGVMLDNLYAALSLFCQKFYDTRVQTILLSGNAGVGKTCLAAAVARDLMRRGVTVIYVKAFELNDVFLKYHTGGTNRRTRALDDLEDCDMLIIDDLGTEPIFKNVTLEYLYALIDARISAGKKIMVTTNLSQNGLDAGGNAVPTLAERYGERIYSRLVNARYSLKRQIYGDNLRKLLP